MTTVPQASRLLAIAILLQAALTIAAEKEWSSYQPGNGACWIKYPANPEYQTQLAEGMTVHVYIAKDTQSPPSTYALSFGDFAKSKVPAGKEAAEKQLDIERTNFVKAVNGKLVSEKPAPIEGNPGREFSVASEDAKARYTIRQYLVGARIFHLVVWQPLARAENGTADVAKFFDSFQLGK